MEIPEFESNEPFEWEPPKEHGLNNSEHIIPNYYNSGTNLITLDYFSIIKDDIRNMRPLNIQQMEYITTQISDDKKNELFDIFNQCLTTINDVFNTL